MIAARLILASASPQRRGLLLRVYPDFEVIPCQLREPDPPPTSELSVQPRRWALALAYFKARAVAELHPGRWVLGADTVVDCGGQMLGKARDAEEARRMLVLQTSRPSEVITGLCLLRLGPEPRRLQRVDVTRVCMRDDAVAREAYVAGGDWRDKAGAYGIQTVGDRLVERIEGSFSNVVGLPLRTLAALLVEAGLSPRPVGDDEP